MIRLSQDTLAHLPDGVLRPTYDRSALSAGILQVGVGNFHRAHQAWYLHRLFQQGRNRDWAIVGAGVRPFDAKQREKFIAQDHFTTLIELDPAGRSAEVIGSMIDYVPVEETNRALIDRMAQPDIRIVALTVTEGGYYLDLSTQDFDATHPDILFDVAHPETPRTVFGAMVAALRLRRSNGHGPFTGLSCDNLQSNGAILRNTVASLARLTDAGLADWIEGTYSFPNSMVDCIVPATGPKELALAQSFGIKDTVPVTHENFRQWVIEDDFCAGRPDWGHVGATLVADVHDFEAMKIRILNGGHQVLASMGELLGLETIADCMAHAGIHGLFHKVAREEITPHVKPVPDMSPAAYVDLIDRRFSNPEIIDTTRRVAFDGSSRHPGFVVPSIRDCLAQGTSVSGLALVEAAWARMCAGTRENGAQIAPNDPNWDALQTAARAARADPMAWLAQTQYYGDLGQCVVFAEAFGNWLRILWDQGGEAALTTYLHD